MLYAMYDNEFKIIATGSTDIPETLEYPYVTINSEDLKYELTIVDNGFGGKKVQRENLKSLVKVLSKYQFRNRFTIEEKIAIENYDTNDSLTTEQKAVLKVILKDSDISDIIELEEPTISAGLDILVSYGLLEAERKAEILEIKDTP